ncbi:MAG: lytic transglycosylase domain-containing protein [Desulfobacterales bacterium]|nr:MAG: lytic transglycosylase domain-containing protein [Desulfobacterales bacterium]
MDELVPKNCGAKALGLWISVTGIGIGLLLSAGSSEPTTNQPLSVYHEIPPPLISNNPPAYEPITIEFKSIDLLDVIDWEETSLAADGTGSLPALAPEPKTQNIKGAEGKIPSVRGKQAERLFRSFIYRVAHRHHVDPAMVQAIIMAESSFNPHAISKRGAIGLMQLMPDTAKSLGIEDPLNPEHNITGGVLYFKKLLKEFRGDVKLALAAYNSGSRKVKEYQGVPPFKSTQVYIEKVFEYYRHYKNISLKEDDEA